MRNRTVLFSAVLLAAFAVLAAMTLPSSNVKLALAFGPALSQAGDLDSRLPQQVRPTPSGPQERTPDEIARLQDKAAELEKLASDIKSETRQLGRDQPPSDLISKLKQVEKLSKQLRKDLGRP